MDEYAELKRVRDFFGVHGYFENPADEMIYKLGEELAGLAERLATAENSRFDYICAICHYGKYGSRFTFSQTSQWTNLKFGSYEDYQEFTMQLVYLLAEARKKYENNRPKGQED